MKSKLKSVLKQFSSFRNSSRQVDSKHAAEFFDAVYYKRMYPDVANAGVDLLGHYLKFGWKEGRDPNAWFSTKDYILNNQSEMENGVDPLTHYALRGDGPTPGREDQSGKSFLMVKAAKPQQGCIQNIFMSRPSKGDEELVKLHMDEEFYLAQAPELEKTGVSASSHYLAWGWIEGLDPSPDFSTRYYLKHNADIRESTMNPFVHFLKRGIKENWRKKADVKSAEILNRFEEGPLAEAVNEAIELDPMVALPLGVRKLTSPILNNEKKLAAATGLREFFANKSYEHVVLIPHVRMSGATRIGGHLTTAVAERFGTGNVLVLRTDASMLEFPEWFPDYVELFDLSQCLEDIKNPVEQSDLLLDLLLGVGCIAIYNVNSRLCWNALQTYGRQMAQEFNVSSYLFCWEETNSGVQTGYPIQWLRDTIDYHHQLLTDSQFLADNISRRFGLDKNSTPSVTALQTPYVQDEHHEPLLGIGKKLARKQNRLRPKALWAGRFDRQKRLDVLVRIAKANPHIDFWVFGKPVIDNKGLKEFNPPRNIHEQPPFEHFNDILDLRVDFFLYTAQWDGLPTILLDAAMAEMPIVAPGVGGIAELVNNETGWLISDLEDEEEYSAAIQNILADKAEAQRRTAAMKKKVATERTREAFMATVSEIFGS